MLDDFAGIINGFNSFGVLGILSDKDGVLIVSGGLFSGIGVLVVFNILDGNSQISFGLGQGFSGVVSDLGVGIDLVLLIVDSVININSDSVTSGLISSVDSVVVLLVRDDTSDDLIKEEVHFVNGGLGLEVDGNGGQDGVSE